MEETLESLYLLSTKISVSCPAFQFLVTLEKTNIYALYWALGILNEFNINDFFPLP